MRRVMAVEFGPHGRLRYLDPGDEDYRVGDTVLVPTEHGPETARCVWAPREAEWEGGALPLCAGPAAPADLARDEANRERREEVRRIAIDLIARHRLPMTVVALDYVDPHPEAGRLAVIYFKAPQRVDFRSLLGDLARTLQARVDLRQVGGRDIAALAGDLGPCGRELCCCALCPVSEPVPARVSRDQESANSSLQLAGTCGRLKCCLAYEADAYADFAARAPGIGSVVATSLGEGVVNAQSMPIDAVWIRTEDGLRSVPVSQATVVRPAPDVEPRLRGRGAAVGHVSPDEPAAVDRPPVPTAPTASVRPRRPFLRRERKPRER